MVVIVEKYKVHFYILCLHTLVTDISFFERLSGEIRSVGFVSLDILEKKS